jgi:hypothetical protein
MIRSPHVTRPAPATYRGCRVAVLACAIALVSATVAAEGLPAAAEEGREGGSCWPGDPGSDPRLCPPDDPRYAGRWEFSSDIPDEIDRSLLHPAEAALGSIGISLDRAWQHTTGRDDVVIAVLDSGIRWGYRDLANKIYLNSGELPFPEGATVHDQNGDGVFSVLDFAGDSRVADGNANGLLDAEDLILAFADCSDDDGNGYPDDIAGYDFFAGSHCGFAGGDNNPRDDTDFGHGTGIGSTAAAETNNGLRDAGVCPDCRVLPVRVGDSFVVDANRFARGVVFAVHAGASVIASALGSYNNTPAARAAVDFAYAHGVTIIASAADEFSYHHNYPSVYNHTLYVNAIRYNHAKNFRKASTFWGLNPCTNFGARVWITVPATSCSSGATSRLAGVAGLVHSAALDAGLGRLHAEEVYQILRMTADDLDNSEPDWGALRFPAKPGFDQLYGYGRLNALRAVEAVEARRIPPRVDLTNPDWFAIVSPKRNRVVPVAASIDLPRARRAVYRLDYALGVEPREHDYTALARGEIRGSMEGVIGAMDFAQLPMPSGPAPRGRADRDRFSVTLRLRVTDDAGLTAEARRSFFVFEDPTWKQHFPLALGASGEASPILVDLDADGDDEIVVPTADGKLRFIDWAADGLAIRVVELDRLPAIDPRRSKASAPRETAVRGAVVGDLDGDGTRSIVLASKDGKVYVFDVAGRRRKGFPVALLPASGAPASPTRVVERGILSRPTLADLDGRPGREIVVTALDGRVYAWRHDGSLVDGFPVRVRNPARSPEHGAKLVSTPAVGDIDGDGHPEIVFGSNELHEGVGAAYAMHGSGGSHPDGPFLRGWQPFELAGVRPDLLPTLAHGVTMRPLLVDADADGDLEVVLYAVTGDAMVLVDTPGEGNPQVLERYSMVPGARSELQGISFIAGTGSPLLADTDGDGNPEIYSPLLPFRMLTLRSKPGVPLDVPLALGGWPLRGQPETSGRVPMLESFPRRMEDMMILASPSAADVDGDGTAEVLMGSGGYLLHAFKTDGGEALDFPKFTGGWIFSTPAVGDLDGDGRRELVTVTREGYLFAWELPSDLVEGDD